MNTEKRVKDTMKLTRYWALSVYPARNERTAGDEGAVITCSEVRHDASTPYLHVRICLPDSTEAELNFDPDTPDSAILATPIRAFRII